jgi:hypothetical protein
MSYLSPYGTLYPEAVTSMPFILMYVGHAFPASLPYIVGSSFLEYVTQRYDEIGGDVNVFTVPLAILFYPGVYADNGDVGAYTPTYPDVRGQQLRNVYHVSQLG